MFNVIATIDILSKFKSRFTDRKSLDEQKKLNGDENYTKVGWSLKLELKVGF